MCLRSISSSWEIPPVDQNARRFEEAVDLLPPLYLYKSSGKVVLGRSEVGKSCPR
jgi:hypothetical protein